MIKVSGLPVNITKSDLDELFLPYGTIKSVVIKNQQTESIAHVELDKNEQLAIQALDRTKWRDKTLHLDSSRGNGTKPGQRGAGDQNQKDGDQNPKGGDQNPVDGNPNKEWG